MRLGGELGEVGIGVMTGQDDWIKGSAEDWTGCVEVRTRITLI